MTLPACSKESGDAVVIENEQIAVAQVSGSPSPNEQKLITPATLPTNSTPPAAENEKPEELGPNEIVVDGYVMNRDLRGTKKDPRALQDAQWLVRVRLLSNGRRIDVHAAEAQYKKLNPGDRVRITYRVGKYTGTVWNAVID